MPLTDLANMKLADLNGLLFDWADNTDEAIGAASAVQSALGQMPAVPVSPPPGTVSGRFPVPGFESGLQEDFGEPREYRNGTHEGTDIGAPEGTPIVSPENGTVTGMHTSTNGGNILWIEDEQGRTHKFMHLTASGPYASGISIGSRVKAGQVVAYVGDTGASSAPHLHYELHDGGYAVNPHDYLQGLAEGTAHLANLPHPGEGDPGDPDEPTAVDEITSTFEGPSVADQAAAAAEGDGIPEPPPGGSEMWIWHPTARRWVRRHSGLPSAAITGRDLPSFTSADPTAARSLKNWIDLNIFGGESTGYSTFIEAFVNGWGKEFQRTENRWPSVAELVENPAFLYGASFIKWIADRPALPPMFRLQTPDGAEDLVVVDPVRGVQFNPVTGPRPGIDIPFPSSSPAADDSSTRVDASEPSEDELGAIPAGNRTPGAI